MVQSTTGASCFVFSTKKVTYETESLHSRLAVSGSDIVTALAGQMFPVLDGNYTFAAAFVRFWRRFVPPILLAEVQDCLFVVGALVPSPAQAHPTVFRGRHTCGQLQSWCSGNEKWNDPYKPCNWWFRSRESGSFHSHSLPLSHRSHVSHLRFF